MKDPNFKGIKREIMKSSIQSSLNNAIYTYNNHTTLSVEFGRYLY